MFRKGGVLVVKMLGNKFGNDLKFAGSLSSATKAIKLSPAAMWHANALGMKLNLLGIVGSGPKGHVLKSDILDAYSQKKREKKYESIDNLLIEVADIEDDAFLKRSIAFTAQIMRVESSEYIRLPGVGLQVKIVRSVENDDGILDKFKRLLLIVLRDPSHLLL